MTVLAFTFVAPLLLIGLLAAGIPLVLHLLSSVRAQEMYFPTLRFLRISMEKTARRRRVQHWLLLLLRMALLALLALAVAQPVSQALGAFLGGQRYAAVLLLDNSMSMAAREGEGTRFDKARAQAATMLSDDDKPSLAAVMTTNGGYVSNDLSSDLGSMREGVAAAQTGYGRAPIAQRLSAALRMLEGKSEPQRCVYVFSDLQQGSFEELLALPELQDEKTRDIHLLVVNTASRPPDNVGIADVQIQGEPIVNRVVTFSATLVNSSATDRIVQASLRIDDKTVGQPVRQRLAAAGQDGSRAVVRFHYAFPRPGPAVGEVSLDASDDLPYDNVRRFSLRVGAAVRALVVRGAAEAGESYWLDPGRMLLLALDPFEDASAPMSIRPQTVEADQFDASQLIGADAAFFCEVSDFTEPQAQAVADFVAGGGTAVFFLGPNVQADNYNERFVQQIPAEGGLLPGRLAGPVGEIGPDAKAESVAWVDAGHPYLVGLYENQADYLTSLVQRHYQLEASTKPAQVLMRLAGGDPLLLTKRFAQGHVVLCTTTASPRWSNLPAQGLFVAMVCRIGLLARQQVLQDYAYLAGSQVTLRAAKTDPQETAESVSIIVTGPGQDGSAEQNTAVLPVVEKHGGYEAVFKDTAQLGVYRWRLSSAGPNELDAVGAFVVNPSGPETDLRTVPAERFKQALLDRGHRRVYVGPSVAAVNQLAAADAEGHNWWDLLAAAAVLILVAEALVANRRRHLEEILPSHLSPHAAA